MPGARGAAFQSHGTENLDEPSCVAAEDDEVIVDGPAGVAVSLTPEAAEETGDRLIHQAAQAAATGD